LNPTVAVGLAIFAFISRSQAIHESHVAVSHELAADSSTVLGSDPELSLLLARQALETDANPSAKLALVSALDQTTVRAILHFGGFHGGVIADSWSPVAPLVALAGQNGVVGLWDPLTNDLERTFKVDDRAVDAVAFSPDGRLLASGGNDDTVEVWDVATGKLLHSFKGSRGLIKALAWSPDGRYLLSGAYDGVARIWSLAANRQVGSVQDERVAEGKMVGVAFGPTGAFFVTTNSVDGFTAVWSFQLPHPTPMTDYRPGYVYQAPNGMALSPDGQQIAMAGGDGNVRLWNWRRSNTVKQLLYASTDPLISVAYNRAGTLVAAGGLDGDARIWTTTGALLQRNPGDRGIVDALAFSPDGRWLATAGSDGTARLWTVRSGSGAQLGVRSFGGGLHELLAGAVSPSGNLVIDADGTGTIHAWHLLGGSQLWQRTVGAGFGACVCALSFDANGGRVAVGETSGVAVLRSANGAPVATRSGPNSVSVALAPSGTVVAAGGTDDRVRIWTLGSPRRPITVTMTRPEGNPDSLAFSPDGKLLAVGLESGNVLLLDASNGAQRGQLTGPEGSVLSLAFAPDGTFLAGGSSDLRVWLWNVAEQRAVRYFEGHTGAVAALGISPNGELIAGGSDDDTTIIWDLRNAEELRVLNGDTDVITSAGFSPNGTEVLTTSADGTLRTWDSCTWCESVPELQAHAEPAIARCFTADEQAIYLHKPNAQNESCSA
jgi:WD40 repeat protein